MKKRYKGALITEAAIIIPIVFIISLLLVLINFVYYENVIGSTVLHAKLEDSALYSGVNYEYEKDSAKLLTDSEHSIYWRFNRQQGSQPLDHFKESKLFGVVANKNVYRIDNFYYVSVPIFPYINVSYSKSNRNFDRIARTILEIEDSDADGQEIYPVIEPAEFTRNIDLLRDFGKYLTKK